MSVNYTCFFETSDGDLDAHFSDKEFSIYALLCFGFTPEANRSIQKFQSPEIPWKMMTLVQRSTVAGVVVFILQIVLNGKVSRVFCFIPSASWRLPRLPKRINCYKD